MTISPALFIGAREGCNATHHDTINAARKHRCTCPKAVKAKRLWHRATEAHRKGRARPPRSNPLPGLPPFYLDPDRACADVDPDLWFPPPAGDASRAKAICGRCPLQRRCADWALTTGQQYGVWGGVDEQTRRQQLLTRKQVAA